MSKKMMKRSLALGALMAFVITGSAMAKTVDGKHVALEGGDGYTISNNETNLADSWVNYTGERIYGGEYLKNGATQNELTSNFIVEGGKFYTVAGAHSVANVTDGSIITVGTTNVTVKDGAYVRTLIGGTLSSDKSTSMTVNTGRSNLIINGGYFGLTAEGKVDNDGNCPEALVIGGDCFKTDGVNPTAVVSNVDYAYTEITGGQFETAIVGGSAAIQYYGGIDANHTMNVTDAEIKITGGEFNHPIVAGGFAYGDGTESYVTNAKITIIGNNGLEINDAIYAGGMTGDWAVNGTTIKPTSTTIANIKEKTIIDISDMQVNDIYGTGVMMGQPNSVGGAWVYSQNADAIVNTTLKLTNVTADNVDIPLGSVTLRVEDTAEDTGNQIVIGNATKGTKLTVEDGVTVYIEANGEVNDAYAGDYNKMVKERFLVNGYDLLETDETINADAIENFTVEEGEVMGAATLNSDGTITTTANQGNTGIKDIVATGLISWRYEMNDMNKRMGELRNANGEHGVWVRMVRGETEYNSVKNQYNQYQLGYDEKLSVDPSWTVGVALSYTEADNNFSKGTGESTNKALSIYGSKLNDDGTFIDLIAKYARLENDFDLGTAKGDYDTNGYSFSAEYGKRIQQGNGLWIEPQVELTYGQVDGATYMVGGRTVNQDNMESLIGRVGFSLGKDISKGNVYARASYLYDFEGETSATFSKGIATDSFEQDLGGGWWEVGVGANINLSKATYIYADIEKTFGGEVDTNWQWNLGVRYSF